jgi:putative transposase
MPQERAASVRVAMHPVPQCLRHRHRYNKTIYKERNIIERFFAKLKHFRRVATRYDKLLANFLGFVKIAAIALSIK